MTSFPTINAFFFQAITFVPFFEVLGNIKTRAFIFREQEVLSNYFHGTKGTPDLIVGIKGTLKSTSASAIKYYNSLFTSVSF